MRNVDWNAVKEIGDMPVPGGYIAYIANVVDVEDKEYLEVWWDFADGQYKGSNRDCYQNNKFWPMKSLRSYKQKALPFFKAFKTCLEVSNPGYTFDTKNLDGMKQKFIGVVLGEEEYLSNDGVIKKRLIVDSFRSVKSIKDGDFKIPDLKRYEKKVEPPIFDLPPEGELPF